MPADTAEELTSFLNKQDELSKQTSNNRKAVLLGVIITQLRCIFSMLSAASVQFLERSIPDLQLNAMRAAFPLLCGSIVLLFKRKYPTIERKAWMWASLMTVTKIINSVVFFGSASFIPLTALTSIYICVRLLVSPLVSKLWLNEDFKLVNIASLLVCIGGVVLILQPYNTVEAAPTVQSPHNNSCNGTCLWQQDQLPNNKTDVNNIEPEVVTSSVMNSYVLGYMLAVSAGVTTAIVTVASKKLSTIIDYSENYLALNFWLYLLYFILSFMLSAMFEHPVMPTTSHQVMWICLHGIAFSVTFPTMLFATERLSGFVANILFSMEVLYMLVMQYSFLQDIMPGHRNWQELLGVFVTLFGAILSTLWLYLQ